MVKYEGKAAFLERARGWPSANVKNETNDKALPRKKQQRNVVRQPQKAIRLYNTGLLTADR